VTRSDLLAIIDQFYPKGLWTDSPGYDETPERARQIQATRRAIAEYATWAAMLDRLRARFEIQERSFHILTGAFDSAYSAKLTIPGAGNSDLGFHVSFLGPCYVVHSTGALDEEPCVSALAQEIEATYGYEPIPPEIGNEIVPDLALDARALGKATIYDCLLSAVWGDQRVDREPPSAGVPIRAIR
jgi:hypothetical protein